jgi:uncharacterized paraquat-inducible protein A
MKLINIEDVSLLKTISAGGLSAKALWRLIKNQRTIDAEPVRYGHWIRNDNGTYSCSECHSWIPNEQHHYARYCLFCGAKMGLEKENENNI